MSKIRKVDVKEFVREKLSTDPKWAKRALLKIYEYQTADEQQFKNTMEDNGVGFNGIDGHILSSFATQLKKKRFLSPKQMDIVHKKMPKYWSQVVKISNEKELHKLIKL